MVQFGYQWMAERILMYFEGSQSVACATSQIPHPSHRLPVKLLRAREQHRPGWHVQPHGERLCGEEGLDQTLPEQDLGRLLQDGKQTAVVDADAALQKSERNTLQYEDNCQNGKMF